MRCTPTTPVTVNGVVRGCPSSRSERPAGLVAKVSWTVRGWTSRKTVVVSPPESRTVRWMRYQTSASVWPTVDGTNEPLVAPEVGATNGCTCVAWWKSICQVNALAGSVPSSGSEPEPA